MKEQYYFVGSIMRNCLNSSLKIILVSMIVSCIILNISVSAYAGDKTYYVTSSQWLNIRAGAGTQYKIIGKYQRNQKITSEEVKNGWHKTSKGWISGKYLSTQKASAGDTCLKTVSGIRVTAYCAGRCCNGSWSNGGSTTTASGMRLYNSYAYANRYCAATPSVGKLGQKVKINIDGKTYTLKIVDRLGSSSGRKIDLFVPSHSQCNRFGVRSGVTGKVYK